MKISTTLAAILLCSGFIIASSTAAKTASYVLTRSPISELLPQSAAYDFLIDSRGFLWVKSSSAISRYDGHSITEIYSNMKLRAGTVNFGSSRDSMLEDQFGKIWFRGNQTSLLAFQPQNSSVVSVYQAGTAETKSDTNIGSIHLDAGGTIWVSEYGEGERSLVLVDTSELKVVNRLSLNEYMAPGDYAVDFAPFDQATMWVMSRSGRLLKCQKNRSTCSQANLKEVLRTPGRVHFSRFVTASDDLLEIATEERGVVRLTLRDGIPQASTLKEGEERVREPIRVTATTSSQSRGNWIGTYRGLFRLENGIMNPLFTSSNSALETSGVVGLEADSAGNLLVGTMDGIYLVRESPFEMFDKNSGLETTIVTNFSETPGGSVLIATLGGLYEMVDDPETGPKIEPAKLDLKDRNPTALEIANGLLWIGYQFEGLETFDTKTWSRVRIPANTSAIRAVSCIEKIFQQLIAVCALDKGLFLFDLDGNLVEHIRNSYFDKASPLVNEVTNVQQLGSSTIAVATFGGVSILDLSTDTNGVRILAYNTVSGPESMSITTGLDGKVWVGSTLDGVYKLHTERRPARATLAKVKFSPSLPDRTIYGLLTDSIGNLWAGTGKGLVKLDPETETIEIFDESDGLADQEFNMGAAFRDSSDLIYFGGNHGFNRFDPKEFSTARSPPPVRVTRIEVNNVRTPYDPAYIDIPELVLNHDDHSVDFEFSTMDIISPGRSTYKYMLEGFDEDWIDIGRRNSATFTNLPAGNYTFRVIGANSDGVWNYDGISLPIRVLPAPWLTWWAFSLYGVLAVCILLFVKRYYETHVLKEAATKQAKQMTLTATRAMDELQDQLRVEQRLVGNLRDHAANTMDTIGELLALESEELEDPLALDTMQRTQQRLQCLRALESGVYFHRDILKVNFRDVVDNIFAGIMDMAPERPCEIVLANQCTETLVPIDTALPLVVITHELLLNSVTHAFEASEGVECITVKLETDVNERAWSLVVADTGPGLPARIHPSNPTTLGMELITRSAGKLNTSVEYDGEHGAAFSIEVPPAEG